MAATHTSNVDDSAVNHFPRPAALPYLAVRGAADAIAWYCDVYGAEHVKEPYVMDDGSIGHAELDFGGTTLYLADEFADLGLLGPTTDHHSVSLMLPVTDTDTTLERARHASARIEREPYNAYGGRNASLIDPFGHRWMLYQPLPEA